MKKISIGLSIFLVLWSVAWAQSNERFDAVTKEAKFAERVIVNEQIRALSPSSRVRRSNCGPACSENGALVLGIKLIGIGGERTTHSLLNLLGLRLDGEASEELDCQFFKRGRRLVGPLTQLDESAVVAWCQAAFIEAKKRVVADVTDVKDNQMCRTKDDVRKVKMELLSSLSQGISCKE